jgi:formylglycine-generating enzyme required for sulfatase activity
LSRPDEQPAGGLRYRYPGPASFGDDPVSRTVFHGRDHDVTTLADRIASEQITILYGKSGIGKTSLLNAGLLPRLRELGFAPVVVRVGGHPGIFAEKVAQAFRAAAPRHQIVMSGELKPESYKLDDSTLLQRFFDGVLLTKGDTFLSPVLIIDQFEELLRADARTVESYAAMLATLFAKGRDGSGRQPNLRLLLSLREEFVGALEDLAPVIPGLLSNLFRLRPLLRDGAKMAIIEPARLQSAEFASPAFEFDPVMIASMMDFLESHGQFEPIQLQIVCRHIEHEVLDRARHDEAYSPVTAASYFADTEAGYQSILERFYLETVDSVENEIDRLRVRDLCEYGLTRPDGYRDSLSGERIQKEYAVSAQVLDALVDARLIRREDRLNDLWYELTHDRLAEAISAKRRFRLPRSVIVFAVASLIAISGIVAALVVEARRSTQLREQQQVVEEQNKSLAARNSEIDTRNREIDGLRSRLTSASQTMTTELIQRGGLKLPKLIDISPGRFLMGSNNIASAELAFSGPAHSVDIRKGFRISQYEITFSQYDQFATAVGRPLPDDEGWGRGTRPVINVSWDDADAYVRWLTLTVRGENPATPAYRLPTEAEWEYVARAGTTGRFGYKDADDSRLCLYANHADESLGQLARNRSCSDSTGMMTAPVGTYLPNGFGVGDTHGNVAEWVVDCWNEGYATAPLDASAVLTGNCDRRVVRGGSWFDASSGLESAARTWNHRSFHDDTTGFRIAQDVR